MTDEPEPGVYRFAKDAPYVYRRPPVDMCLEFCEAHGIESKAHCLNYVSKNLFPTWVKGSVEREKELVENRFRTLAERYRHRIRMWEVTNETLDKSELKDSLSSFFSAPDFIKWNFKTAAKYFPDNTLVINEAHSNVMAKYKGRDSDYYKLIEDALGKGCRIDSIGMQAHWLCKIGNKNFNDRVKTITTRTPRSPCSILTPRSESRSKSPRRPFRRFRKIPATRRCRRNSFASSTAFGFRIRRWRRQSTGI